MLCRLLSAVILLLLHFPGPSWEEHIYCTESPTQLSAGIEPQLLEMPNSLKLIRETHITCEWNITAPAGFFVEITLTEINLKNSRSACGDYITFLDEQGDQIFGRYCRKKVTDAVNEFWSPTITSGAQLLEDGNVVANSGQEFAPLCASAAPSAIAKLYLLPTLQVLAAGDVKFSYRAVRGRMCGLCKDTSDNACVFEQSAADGDQQCRLVSAADNTRTCTTHADVGTCDNTNVYCDAECLTADVGDPCTFPYSYKGSSNLDGCIPVQDLAETDLAEAGYTIDTIGHVCPTLHNVTDDTYYRFRLCADVNDDNGTCNTDILFTPTYCDLHDPCQNGGLCFGNQDMTYFCECVNDWFGQNCTRHLNITLECGPTSMLITIDKQMVTDLTYEDENLHLIDNSCQFTDTNASHVFREIGYQTCGTLLSMETSNTDTHSSSVSFHQEVRASTPDGLFQSGFTAVATCELTATGTVSLQERTSRNEGSSLEGHGLQSVFPLELVFYHDQGYGQQAGVADSAPPIVYETNDPVYLSVRTTNNWHNNTRLVLDSCWSTKDADATALLPYSLFENRCPVDSTFELTQRTDNEIYFTFRSFRFVDSGNYSFVFYVHCSAYLCRADDPNCNQLCDNSGTEIPIASNRAKRDISNAKPNERSTSIVATRGPVIHLQHSKSDHIKHEVEKPFSGKFQENWKSALTVYRDYLGDNLIYIMVFLALIVAALTILSPLLHPDLPHMKIVNPSLAIV